MGRGALRLLAFVDPDQTSSVTLLAAVLKTAAARPDIEVVGVVDAAYQPPSSSPLELPRALARWSMRRAFNLTTEAEPSAPVLLASSASLARRRRIPLLAPRERGVNDPGFVGEIGALEPDASISLMVGQIFRAPLLDACRAPINYHDGLLPQYKGVAATSWSIYERASRSGFSFHVMTEEVDRGPILLQGSVALGANATLWPTERAKTRLACAQLGKLFDLLASASKAAKAQNGHGSSYSRADLRTIRTVADPGTLTLAELQLRLRAFEALDLTLAGRGVNTTALRRIGQRAHDRRLAFRSADGVWLEPSRIGHLPAAVSRMRASLRRSET